MRADLDRAIYLAQHCPGFMPTRDEWEEAQRLIVAMAEELRKLRTAAELYPQGDTTKGPPIEVRV